MDQNRLSNIASREMDKLLDLVIENNLEPFVKDYEVRDNEVFMIEFTEISWSLAFSVTLTLAMIELGLVNTQALAINEKVYIIPKNRFNELYKAIYKS